MLHDLWTRFSFWIEGEWLYFRRYLPELGNWLLFALCLAVLCFVLGFSAGFILGE
jgi:ABC-type transport system involved in cytochrome bd biosynthesis fused ATPase/permease subunit